jgi:hypothetical protein
MANYWQVLEFVPNSILCMMKSCTDILKSAVLSGLLGMPMILFRSVQRPHLKITKKIYYKIRTRLFFHILFGLS